MIYMLDGVDSSGKLQEVGSFDFLELLASRLGLSVNQYEIICLSISSIFLFMFLRNITAAPSAIFIILPFYSVIFANQSNWGIAVSCFLYALTSNKIRYALIGFISHPATIVLIAWCISNKRHLFYPSLVIASFLVFLNEDIISFLPIYFTGYSIQQTLNEVDKMLYIVFFQILIIMYYNFKNKIPEFNYLKYAIFIGFFGMVASTYLGLEILFFRISGVVGILALALFFASTKAKRSLFMNINFIFFFTINFYVFEVKNGWLRYFLVG